ncbi:hypothetical protein SLEP1_g37133 [Rubroshorea leprosula]|uniref:Uncharacterized protein n=1 Tax=Rubroshorea leprosula TaxID=152421 RepID=A0AAV5KU28_9ROSI|nr:hypothetical protein SLEP1_g37133 [Rubroshorea leprosula]
MLTAHHLSLLTSSFKARSSSFYCRMAISTVIRSQPLTVPSLQPLQVCNAHCSPPAPRLGRPLSVVVWPPPLQLCLGFFSNSPTPGINYM